MRDFERYSVPSLNEIAKQAGCEPLATAYLSEQRNSILICSTTSPSPGGMLYVEQPPAKLSWDSDAGEIGKAIWDALLAFRLDPQLGSGNWTDSLPYKASGCKSVRVFKEDFVRMQVIAHPCVLRIEADIPRSTADGMFVGRYITNACDFDQLGALMQSLNRCALYTAEFDFD